MSLSNAKCPHPDCGAEIAVYSDGSYHCFRCNRGGHVHDRTRRNWGFCLIDPTRHLDIIVPLTDVFV